MMSARANLKVCIIARKDLSRNTRVMRQARSLVQRGHDVTIVAIGLPMEETRLTAPSVRHLEVTDGPASRMVTILVRVLDRRTWFRLLVHAPRRAARRALVLVRRLLSQAVVRTLMLLYETLPERQWNALRRLKGGRAAETPASTTVAAPAETVRQSGSVSATAGGARVREAASPSSAPMSRRRSGLLTGLYVALRDVAFAHDAGRSLTGTEFDVVQIHDSHALRVAGRLRQRPAPALMYDAVEIPEDRSGWAAQGVPRFIRRYEARLTAGFVRRMAAVLTVSDGLRDWTMRRYGIPAPAVIRNCRYFEEVSRSDRIRRDCALGAQERLVLYLNSLYGGQGLEQLVDSLTFLPTDIHVATLGPAAQPGYVEGLIKRVQRLGASDRFHFLDVKQPMEMLDYASGADIGVIPRQNTSLNNYHSLPNRVFELIMARLPVAGPSLEDMKTFIERNSIGLIFDETDPKDIARIIESMLEPRRLATLRANVETAAREFCWDREGERYVDLVEQVGHQAAERRQRSPTRPMPQRAFGSNDLSIVSASLLSS